MWEIKVGMMGMQENQGRNASNRSGNAVNRGGNAGNWGRNEGNQGENLRMGVELTNQNCAEG